MWGLKRLGDTNALPFFAKKEKRKKGIPSEPEIDGYKFAEAFSYLLQPRQ
jgi:hypothetical protein